MIVIVTVRVPPFDTASLPLLYEKLNVIVVAPVPPFEIT